jgi:methyltransferase (TIGR00027 family)
VPTAPPTDREHDSAGQVRRSRTAEIVCAERAVETSRAAGRRVIDDPYARHFLSGRSYRFLTGGRLRAAATRAAFDRLYPGYLAVVLLRHREFEQALTRALGDGIEQVVLLGAGYDTTALRRDLDGATLFEVDAPPTQADKRAVLAEHGLADRGTRYVPCDFERDSLPERLLEHGFDPHARSLVAWWGVSFFLTGPAVRRTLSDVATLTAPGSRLLFDYLDRSVVDGTTSYRGARRAAAAVARRGEPYLFGLGRGEAPPLLAGFGFEVESESSMTELARRVPGGFPYSTDDFFGVVAARRAGR